MKFTGIYKIESKIKPERIYIGSSVNIGNRWACHLSNLKLNKHGSIKLQNHYNKYGINDLIFSIIVECKRDDLIKNEQYFIDLYKPYFNTRIFAENNFGIKRSLEYKKKMSRTKKGKKRKPFTEEAKKNMSKVRIGHFVSDHTRKKIGDANRIRIISEETREKLRNRIPYNKGMKMSQEQKDKISNSHKKRA